MTKRMSFNFHRSYRKLLNSLGEKVIKDIRMERNWQSLRWRNWTQSYYKDKGGKHSDMAQSIFKAALHLLAPSNCTGVYSVPPYYSWTYQLLLSKQNISSMPGSLTIASYCVGLGMARINPRMTTHEYNIAANKNISGIMG